MIDIQEKLADETLLYGWKSDPPLTPFAPDYTHYLTDKKIFSEKECQEWSVYLLKEEQILLDKYKTVPMRFKKDGRTGLRETSVTSHFPYFNLLNFDFHLVPKLKKSIYDGIQTLLLHISDNASWQETLYANSWFNVLRQGEAMNTHFHGYHKNTFYGFHVTIKAIAPSFTSYEHPIKFHEGTFHVPNKIGYLTLFPNFIPHSVSVNRKVTPRISIAGDTTGQDESNKHTVRVELG